MSRACMLAYNECTGRVHRAELFGNETSSALDRLFAKAVPDRIRHVKWWCGVAGVDRVVVFAAVGHGGREVGYLHVSFGDQRIWPGKEPRAVAAAGSAA